MKRFNLLSQRRAGLAAAFLAAVLFIGIAGCDFLGSSSTGTLRLLLTDAPFPYDLVEEANVTINRVEIVPGEGEGETEGLQVLVDDEEGEEYNLLELQDGVTELLTQAELEAGPYAQVRLHVSAAEVVLNDEDATTYDLSVPSGAQTGIKVLLPGFEVEEGGITELTLDFDVEESFVVQGSTSGEGEAIESTADIEGFIFKPVIKPVDLEVETEDEES